MTLVKIPRITDDDIEYDESEACWSLRLEARLRKKTRLEASMEDAHGAKEHILRRVVQHYRMDGSEDAAPLLLSVLGAELKKSSVQLPENVGLQSFIRDELGEELVVVVHPIHQQYIAVAPRGKDARIREIVNSHRALGRDSQSAWLDRVDRTLKIAFCRSLDEGQRIYVSVSRPIRHRVSTRGLSNGEWLEIEKEFRLPGVFVKRASQMSNDDVGKFKERIMAWAEKHGISKQKFSTVYQSPGTQVGSSGRQTALDRLLAAQSEDVLSKMVIPGDIVQILLKK